MYFPPRMPVDVLIAEELRTLLSAKEVSGLTVTWLPADAPTPNGDYVGVIPLLSRRIGPEQLDGLPRLRIVANCAVGVDNIDLPAARDRNVIVTNTPDVLTEATADLTWALILAVTRRLKEGQQLIADGRWRGWDPTLLLGLELTGRTLAIVGAGRIGQAVGRRAVGFGMSLLYVSRSDKPEFERSTGAVRTDLPTALAQCDIVTLHVPSNAETRGLLGRAQFALLKEGAFLINTARGDLIHEAALLEALAAGRLGGVGLDVFPHEPQVSPVLVGHPNAVVVPHIGSATTQTRRGMAGLAVKNVRAVLAGKPTVTPVCR